MESKYARLFDLPGKVDQREISLIINHEGGIVLYVSGWTERGDWETIPVALTKDECLSIGIALIHAKLYD